MEIEMGRMEQDIAMLLRERNPHWPMRPDPHPIITVNPDDWSPIVRGRAPTLKGKEGRTYSKTGYGSK
jgi:hypothetical protein